MGPFPFVGKPHQHPRFLPVEGAESEGAWLAGMPEHSPFTEIAAGGRRLVVGSLTEGVSRVRLEKDITSQP